MMMVHIEAAAMLNTHCRKHSQPFTTLPSTESLDFHQPL